MKKDSKIKKLEEERDWYRKEALRLDTFSTAMKKDLKYMKEKLDSVEDDRRWLEKQLKTSKKQNKLLRAEIDIRLSSTEPMEPTQQSVKSRSGSYTSTIPIPNGRNRPSTSSMLPSTSSRQRHSGSAFGSRGVSRQTN